MVMGCVVLEKYKDILYILPDLFQSPPSGDDLPVSVHKRYHLKDTQVIFTKK